MPFWYNEPKQDEKFSHLYRSDWNECNASIMFTELGIKENDTFYFLYMYADSVNDVTKIGAARDWKFPTGELTTLKIAKKTYQKQDFKTKQQVTVEQHRVEKLFCNLLAKYDLDKVYSGSLFMQDGNIVDMLIDAKDGSGKPIASETINMMSQPYLTLEVVEKPEHIKLTEIDLPTIGSGNSGTKGYSQSELNKLNDRLNFIIAQLKLALPDESIENIADIYRICNNPDSNKATIAVAVWEYCTILIK
jgi:hypothetical protein